jgi:Uncharacterized alpha/beta hydrolase domain (DUF2235)
MLLQYQSQNALPFRERCKSIGCAFGAHYVVDGTWNTVNDNTNVWRLKSLVADTSKDCRKQHVYYSTGVGTTFGSPIGGGMLSYGLNAVVSQR